MGKERHGEKSRQEKSGREPVTREIVLQAMKECAAELGHPPSLSELQAHKGIYDRHIRKHFLTYKLALAECGMERKGSGYKVSPNELFADWAELVRKLGKVPNIHEYDMHSRYSHRPLVSRFGNWRQAQAGLLAMATENGWENEWKDVVDILRTHLRGKEEEERMSMRRGGGFPEDGLFADRPIYGPPVVPFPLAHGPVNEAGVLFLFGRLAGELGFVVTRIQTDFPDCEAMWQVQPGVWQRVRIELEYESRNFVKHLHDAGECDLIVCWVHNWAECPLHVVELRKALMGRSDDRA